jgi:hypothetical protein
MTDKVHTTFRRNLNETKKMKWKSSTTIRSEIRSAAIGRNAVGGQLAFHPKWLPEFNIIQQPLLLPSLICC